MSRKEKQEELRRGKGADRIQINNILAAASIAILSVLLGLSGKKFSNWLVIQIAAAVPLLITSSLAYAKIGYREVQEYNLWDKLGWLTLSLGYIMLLNALTILLYTCNYSTASWWFVGITIGSFAVYSGLDVKADKHRLKEKFWKFVFYVILIFFGAILPILLKCV